MEDKSKQSAGGAGSKLFAGAKRVPLVTWLHMLPVVGMVFGPFDVMRAAKQAEQIETLTSQFGKALERDLNRAFASGRFAPARFARSYGFGSTEFAPLHEQLARHETAKRNFIARLKPVHVHALHAQRAIALHRPNLVHSSFRAREFLKKDAQQ